MTPIPWGRALAPGEVLPPLPGAADPPDAPPAGRPEPKAEPGPRGRDLRDRVCRFVDETAGTLRPFEALVWVLLEAKAKKRRGGGWTAKVSQEVVAERLGKGPDAVKDAFAALRRAGLIVPVDGFGNQWKGPTEYELFPTRRGGPTAATAPTDSNENTEEDE